MFRTKFNEETKQWSGESIESLWDGETSLGVEIFKAFQLHSSKIAQICAITGDTKTFDDFRILTVRAAKNLQRLGCVKGEKIFILIGNVPGIPPLVFGAICLGCTIVTLATSATQADCEYFLNLTKPEFAICHMKSYVVLQKCFENLKINAKIITDNGQTEHSIPIERLFECVDDETHFEPVKLNSIHETAFILRTSGTTGFNKAICISHATILDKLARLRGFFQSTDVILKYVGLEGVAGVRYLFGAALNGSALIVNTGHFSPPQFFKLIERFKVTTAYAGVHTIVQMLQHSEIETANLNSIRLFVSGGSSISFQTIQKMSKYLKNGHFCNTYGLTETFGTVTCNMQHTQNNCAGQLIRGDDVKIVNDHGKCVGINETGEVCIKLPFAFPGYLNNTEDMNGCVDNGGFFRTGDEGRFDENGDLFVDDRKKEIFKSHGYRISPVEMETFINGIPGVRESCVVPIPVETVQSIAAAVIVKDQCSNCTEQSIYDAVANHFADYKRLDGGIYFIDTLPLTASGKITRYLVKHMAIERFNEANKGKD